jgi:hypothetical protein
MASPSLSMPKTCLWFFIFFLSLLEVESFCNSGHQETRISSASRFTTNCRNEALLLVTEQTRISLALHTAATSTELADQYDPNQITPETKTITGSMAFFARFVIQSLVSSKLKKSQTKLLKKSRQRGSRRKSFLENLSKLNEQRKNLVTLAGYNSHIVIPSFSFLFLGALMTSIVPLYESKCIQLVATLHPSKAKVIEALIGLILSSTLASLFTGLRGSLFWLAGTFP